MARIENRDNSRWWQNYQVRGGYSSFSADDRALMKEITRLFGMPWSALPVIIASTNLWLGEYVSCPTSLEHFDIQLNGLSKLPGQYENLSCWHIIKTLQSIVGDRVDYHPPSEPNRQRFNSHYKILNTFDKSKNLKDTDYRYELVRQLTAAQKNIDFLRKSYRDRQLEELIPAIDSMIEDAAGRFIALESVAAKGLRNLNTSVELPLPDLLDDESAVMIETSLRVGSFLERLSENALDGLASLGRGRQQEGYWRRGEYGQNKAFRRPNDPPMLDIDFTPGAQGVWKAFELEVNLSVIQAARAARNIAMPTYFTLHDPNLPPEQGRVETGHRRYVNINQLDWSDRSSGRHRFITLGDALYLVRAMLNSRTEELDSVIQKAIGSSLPRDIMNIWETIISIRNQGSHVCSLKKRDYETIKSALRPDILQPLLNIKDAILQGRTP